MTFSEPTSARSAMSPSVIPSPRYVVSGLPAKSRKGSTAIAVTPLGTGWDPRLTITHTQGQNQKRASRDRGRLPRAALRRDAA